MTNDKYGHIPSPLSLFTSTAVRQAPLEWQMNKGVHPNASKSKLNANRPDHSNCFNYINNSSQIASCCAATCRRLLTLPGVADTYPFLMNTWNTLLESYQQRVNIHTVAAVKHQIQRPENPTPTVVIRVEAAVVDNAVLHDYLTSEVVRKERDIRSIDPNITIDIHCTDDELHIGIPGGSGNYKDEGDESNKGDAIPTTSRQRQPVTKLKRFDLRTSHADGYVGKKCNDTGGDVNEEEEASQSDDGST
jgi:hypothetical protein